MTLRDIHSAYGTVRHRTLPYGTVRSVNEPLDDVERWNSEIGVSLTAARCANIARNMIDELFTLQVPTMRPNTMNKAVRWYRCRDHCHDRQGRAEIFI